MKRYEVSERRWKTYPPDKVVIKEVGLRDGLQLVKQFPSTEAKARWLQTEYSAGVRHFEVGSYLPSKTAPQFADIDVLVENVANLESAFSSSLVLNKKGAVRALEGKTDEINCVISASEDHNLRNARRTREEGLHEISDVLRMRAERDVQPLVSVGIAMAFGCTIKGAVPTKDVVSIAERCAEMGVDVIGIADTVGFGGPKQVSGLVADLKSAIGDTPLCMHFHDTRGMGIANVAAALDSGITIFDASIAGLGGCPFAPMATGNVVFEDVVFLCENMGFHTGISIEGLMPAREIIASEMPLEQLHGQLAKAGLPIVQENG